MFLYFECFFIARGPHLPIVTGFCCFAKEEGKAQTMEDVLITLQSGLDSALKEILLFAWTAVRSDLQRLPHPMSLSKRYWHVCEMGFTMTLLSWVSKTIEDGDFVPFRAMPCQTAPLLNKFLLMSSLNIRTLISEKIPFSLYHSAYLFLVGWKSGWATSYLRGFSPLFIFLISPAYICTSGSNSVFCVIYVSLFWAPMKSVWQEGVWMCGR